MRRITFADNQFHSTYSDGSFTPRQIFDYNQLHDRLDLTITDHVDKNTDWFERYVAEITELRQQYKDFTVKIGCEVKIIDERGELNTTEKILSQAEVVTGTVHHFPGIKALKLEELIAQELTLTKLLAQNKKITVLGHPFSMVTRFFQADVPDGHIREVYELCVKNGIKLEYNKKNCPPSVRRLVISEIAKGNIGNFSFGSDMHYDLSELGNSAFDVADPVHVLVTGAGAGIGQSIIKALKLSFIKTKIVAVDCDSRAAGLYRADSAHIIPHCGTDDYIPKIIELCQQEKIDLIFIGTDLELLPLAEHKELIESRTSAKVIVSALETINIANDKWKTVEFLKSAQLPYPQTWQSQDMDQATLPAVVKPRIGARSIGFTVVKNINELKYAVNTITDPIIQEHLADDDSEYTCSGFFYEGECYGVACAQRWLRNGDTYKAYFCHDAELEAFIKEVGKKLNIVGPCNFQLRKTKDGSKIFEINCRFSGTTGAASWLGFNVTNTLMQKIVFNRPLHSLDFKESLMLRYWNEVFINPQQAETLKIDGALSSAKSEINIF